MSLQKCLRRTKTKPGTSEQVLHFGVRVGWWPCLRSPFVEVALGPWTCAIWYSADGARR